MQEKKGFIKRYQEKWQIDSVWQVLLILGIFAITGFSTLFVIEMLYRMLGIPEAQGWWMRIIMFVFVSLPIHNMILLFYGFIFGQFKWFWTFEKMFFKKLFRRFRRKSTPQ